MAEDHSVLPSSASTCDFNQYNLCKWGNVKTHLCGTCKKRSIHNLCTQQLAEVEGYEETIFRCMNCGPQPKVTNQLFYWYFYAKVNDILSAVAHGDINMMRQVKNGETVEGFIPRKDGNILEGMPTASKSRGTTLVQYSSGEDEGGEESRGEGEPEDMEVDKSGEGSKGEGGEEENGVEEQKESDLPGEDDSGEMEMVTETTPSVSQMDMVLKEGVGGWPIGPESIDFAEWVLDLYRRVYGRVTPAEDVIKARGTPGFFDGEIFKTSGMKEVRVSWGNIEEHMERLPARTVRRNIEKYALYTEPGTAPLDAEAYASKSWMYFKALEWHDSETNLDTFISFGQLVQVSDYTLPTWYYTDVVTPSKSVANALVVQPGYVVVAGIARNFKRREAAVIVWSPSEDALCLLQPADVLLAAKSWDRWPVTQLCSASDYVTVKSLADKLDAAAIGKLVTVDREAVTQQCKHFFPHLKPAVVPTTGYLCDLVAMEKSDQQGAEEMSDMLGPDLDDDAPLSELATETAPKTGKRKRAAAKKRGTSTVTKKTPASTSRKRRAVAVSSTMDVEGGYTSVAMGRGGGGTESFSAATVTAAFAAAVKAGDTAAVQALSAMGGTLQSTLQQQSVMHQEVLTNLNTQWSETLARTSESNQATVNKLTQVECFYKQLLIS